MLKKSAAILTFGFLILLLICCVQPSRAHFISWRTLMNKENLFQEATINFELKKNIGQGKFFFSPCFQADNQNGSEGVITNLVDNYKTQRMVDIKEVGIAYQKNALEIGLGKKIFNWGQTFEINPVDAMNPRDYSDLLDWEKIGVAGAWAKVYLGNQGMIEALGSFFTPARLPMQKKNQWFLPLPEGLLFKERILPKQSLQFSGRLSLIARGWDLDILGHYGCNPFPYFLAEKNLSLSSIAITPVYFRYSMFGVSCAKTLLKNIVFRGEAGYFTPDKTSKDDSYLQTVFCLDRFWPNVVKQSSLHTVVQYARETIAVKGKNPSPDNWARIFKNHISSTINLDIPDWRLGLKLKTLYNVSEKDSYSEITASLEPMENLNVEVAVDILEGPKNSFFGQYSEKDRLKINIKYLF